MIEYSADGNIAVYDGYRFRRDKNTGYYLCSKKTDAGTRERLHVYVYRKANGEIPKGMHVHHKDGDKRNNELENLVLLTEHEHEKWHSEHITDEFRERRHKNVVERAVPAARAWHSTESGIE